jgi:hypothetical protein
MARLAALLMVPVATFIASCDLFHTTSAPPAGMGQEALDGKFAFIVSNVNTSPTFGRTPAQGVYVIVSMAVRNVGTEAQLFEMAAQKLKDSTGVSIRQASWTRRSWETAITSTQVFR